MEGSLSPADVAVLSGNRGNGNGGFGDNGAWWIIIFLIFAMGWRGNGFGNDNGGNNGNGGGFYPYPYFANVNNDTQRGFDQSAVISGINTINANISDLARQACDNRFDVVTAINNSGFENRTGIMSLQSQLAQCCCDNRAGIADLKYTVATENCADREALSNGLRDVIASNTANTQAILDKLCQQEIDAKNDTIANLRTQVNMQTLAASQAAQTNDIVNAVRPCPIPSYLTCSPYQSIPVQYVAAGCGCGNNNNLF